VPGSRQKARAPYEFGCKVSIATPVIAPKGGQFVLHSKALHGNPYDGHTLGPVIADLEKLTDVTVRRIHSDKGFVAGSGEHGVAAPLGTGTENL
jgi:transposase, IS5 family